MAIIFDETGPVIRQSLTGSQGALRPDQAIALRRANPAAGAQKIMRAMNALGPCNA